MICPKQKQKQEAKEEWQKYSGVSHFAKDDGTSGKKVSPHPESTISSRSREDQPHGPMTVS